MQEASLKEKIKLHFIILIFSFTAILGKLISLPALGVVVYRTFFATIGILTIVLISKKKLKISRRKILTYIFIGVILGLHWICFFASARLSNVSVSLVTISTATFFTSILEPIFYKRKISILELGLGLLIVVGMALVFKFEGNYNIGIIVGLISSILSALYAVLNGLYVKKTRPIIVNTYELGAAFFATFLITLIFDPQALIISNTNDLIYLLILAIICTVYPYVTLIDLFKYFSPFTINLNINLEPIYGMFLAYIFFGESEKMSPEFYLGTSLIIGSVMLQALLNKYWNKQKNLPIA